MGSSEHWAVDTQLTSASSLFSTLQELELKVALEIDDVDELVGTMKKDVEATVVVFTGIVNVLLNVEFTAILVAPSKVLLTVTIPVPPPSPDELPHEYEMIVISKTAAADKIKNLRFNFMVPPC